MVTTDYSSFTNIKLPAVLLMTATKDEKEQAYPLAPRRPKTFPTYAKSEIAMVALVLLRIKGRHFPFLQSKWGFAEKIRNFEGGESSF